VRFCLVFTGPDGTFGSIGVKALFYNSDGREFDTRLCE
jgi:hypothetical protein